MVVIRLQRIGKKNTPSYRVVVADSRTSVRGECIEVVGFYDPIHKTCSLKSEKIDAWKAKGAKMSDSVAHLLEKGGKIEKKKANKPNRKAVLRQKMAEEAKAAEAAAKLAEQEAAKAAKEASAAAPEEASVPETPAA